MVQDAVGGQAPTSAAGEDRGDPDGRQRTGGSRSGKRRPRGRRRAHEVGVSSSTGATGPRLPQRGPPTPGAHHFSVSALLQEGEENGQRRVPRPIRAGQRGEGLRPEPQVSVQSPPTDAGGGGSKCLLAPQPVLSSFLSFVFLQLYHSPFFGNEANKPLLLPKTQAS